MQETIGTSPSTSKEMHMQMKVSFLQLSVF